MHCLDKRSQLTRRSSEPSVAQPSPWPNPPPGLPPQWPWLPQPSPAHCSHCSLPAPCSHHSLPAPCNHHSSPAYHNHHNPNPLCQPPVRSPLQRSNPCSAKSCADWTVWKRAVQLLAHSRKLKPPTGLNGHELLPPPLIPHPLLQLGTPSQPNPNHPPELRRNGAQSHARAKARASRQHLRNPNLPNPKLTLPPSAQTLPCRQCSARLGSLNRTHQKSLTKSAQALKWLSSHLLSYQAAGPHILTTLSSPSQDWSLFRTFSMSRTTSPNPSLALTSYPCQAGPESPSMESQLLTQNPTRCTQATTCLMRSNTTLCALTFTLSCTHDGSAQPAASKAHIQASPLRSSTQMETFPTPWHTHIWPCSGKRLPSKSGTLDPCSCSA
jgi:hypothetical protein